MLASGSFVVGGLVSSSGPFLLQCLQLQTLRSRHLKVFRRQAPLLCRTQMGVRRRMFAYAMRSRMGFQVPSDNCSRLASLRTPRSLSGGLGLDRWLPLRRPPWYRSLCVVCHCRLRALFCLSAYGSATTTWIWMGLLVKSPHQVWFGSLASSIGVLEVLRPA